MDLKPFIFLLATSISFCLSTFAQDKNFESGYILQGTDTISGLIYRSDEQALSKMIKFKASESDSLQQFYPSEIKEFGFKTDKLCFKTVNFKLASSSDSINELRFAKVLIRGAVNLYKLQVSSTELPAIFLTNNTFVYIIEKEGEFYTLAQLEKQDGSSYQLQKKYVGLFIALFNDCAALNSFDFNTLRFEDDEVINLTEKYNRCIKPEAESKTYVHKTKSVIKHGLETYSGSIIQSATNQITSSYFISMGYFWDILKPELSTKHSFRTGINYTYLTYNLQKYSFGEHYLKMPLMDQLNLRNTKYKNVPFINFGITCILSTNTGFDYLDMIPFINLGAGIYLNKVKLSVLIENTALSPKADKLISLGLGWRFK